MGKQRRGRPEYSLQCQVIFNKSLKLGFCRDKCGIVDYTKKRGMKGKKDISPKEQKLYFYTEGHKCP